MDITFINNIINNSNNNITNILNNLENEIINIVKEYQTNIINKNEEIENLTKVSMIHQLHKELSNKNNYIEYLEKKIKYLESNTNININTIENNNTNNNINTNDNINNIENKKKKKFNKYKFEEIDGYSLIKYKKEYYLRELETDNIYDILNYKPNKIVGLIINEKIEFK